MKKTLGKIVSSSLSICLALCLVMCTLSTLSLNAIAASVGKVKKITCSTKFDGEDEYSDVYNVKFDEKNKTVTVVDDKLNSDCDSIIYAALCLNDNIKLQNYALVFGRWCGESLYYWWPIYSGKYDTLIVNATTYKYYSSNNNLTKIKRISIPYTESLTTFKYGSNGEVKEIEETTEWECTKSIFSYDSNGNIIRAQHYTDNKNDGESSFTYDTEGRLKSVKGPVSDDSFFYRGKDGEQYYYDKNRKLEKMKTAVGIMNIAYQGEKVKSIQCRDDSSKLTSKITFSY